MKRSFYKLFTTKLILLASAILLLSCDKTATPDPKPDDKKWIVVYKDVMLGDQNNTSIGQFLKTQTGTVFSIDNAFSEQGTMSMVYFSEYGNNRLYLTFPGNAYGEAYSKESETNNLFDRPTVGLNHWDAANMNSGEISLAATMEQDMSRSEFDALASSLNWKEFDSKFREYNSGDADLSNVAAMISPGNGDVYMLQLNNAIRAFIYIKNVIPGGSAGGSVRFDMVIEGGSVYNSDPETKRINPAKD